MPPSVDKLAANTALEKLKLVKIPIHYPLKDGAGEDPLVGHHEPAGEAQQLFL